MREYILTLDELIKKTGGTEYLAPRYKSAEKLYKYLQTALVLIINKLINKDGYDSVVCPNPTEIMDFCDNLLPSEEE